MRTSAQLRKVSWGPQPMAWQNRNEGYIQGCPTMTLSVSKCIHRFPFGSYVWDELPHFKKIGTLYPSARKYEFKTIPRAAQGNEGRSGGSV